MPTQAFEIATYRFEPYPVKTVDGVQRRDLPLATTRNDMLKMARQHAAPAGYWGNTCPR